MSFNIPDLLAIFASPNPTVLFFYKGTAFPCVIDAPDFEEQMMKGANKMIISGMKNGFSMEQQKQDYQAQLHFIEQTLQDNSQGGRVDEKGLLKAFQGELKKMHAHDSIDSIHVIWCLDICALLKMKVIENDENNGILRIN